MDTQIITTADDHYDLVDVATQGPPGPQGPQGLSGAAVSSYIASVALSGHIAIVLNADGQALPADPTNPAHYTVSGITTQAAAAGDPVEVVSKGVLEHLGWAHTVAAPVFLGAAGSITQAATPGAVFSKVLGVAVSATRVSIDFQPAIFY